MGFNGRLLAGYTIALVLIAGIYFWLGRFGGGTISFVFLFLLPPSMSAFIAWIGSSGRDWGRGGFIVVPLILTSMVIAVGAVFFREGVICIVMLAPVWVLMGLLGVWPIYRWRRDHAQSPRDIFRANGLLLLPIVALGIEAQVRPPMESRTVATSIVIAATPDQIWPQLESIADVRDDEGRWTITHSLLRVPRPTSALLNGRDIGAVRHGRWSADIRFDEVITLWQPGGAMAWRFSFPDRSLSDHTDRHLSVTGPHSWVERGGYQLQPMPGRRTRVKLWTQYRVATPVNAYAALWGRLFLGDIQGNILAIINDRVTIQREAI